jgi:hypothetical protein
MNKVFLAFTVLISVNGVMAMESVNNGNTDNGEFENLPLERLDITPNNLLVAGRLSTNMSSVLTVRASEPTQPEAGKKYQLNAEKESQFTLEEFHKAFVQRVKNALEVEKRKAERAKELAHKQLALKDEQIKELQEAQSAMGQALIEKSTEPVQQPMVKKGYSGTTVFGAGVAGVVGTFAVLKSGLLNSLFEEVKPEVSSWWPF